MIYLIIANTNVYTFGGKCKRKTDSEPQNFGKYDTGLIAERASFICLNSIAELLSAAKTNHIKAKSRVFVQITWF
jgi:hypothetical protein